MSDAYKARVKRGVNKQRKRQERREGQETTQKALEKTLGQLEQTQTITLSRPSLNTTESQAAETVTEQEVNQHTSSGFSRSLGDAFSNLTL